MMLLQYPVLAIKLGTTEFGVAYPAAMFSPAAV